MAERKSKAGLAGFVLGLVGGYCLVLGGYIVAVSVFGYQDFEGALGMGVATVYAPAGGIALGFLLAAIFNRRADAKVKRGP